MRIAVFLPRLFGSPNMRTVQIRRAIDSPATAAIVTAFLYVIFVAALWDARDRDITRFIVLGTENVDESRLPARVATIPGWGYDGTAFYRLALDPFTSETTAYGISFDAPAYRQQRIGYPLIVWLLSAGQPRAVPWLLVIVNIVAVASIAAVGASYARESGRHAMAGLLFAIYPGFVYSVSRDLAEPLACLFGLSAIVAITRRRHLAAAALLCAAVLTRETFLIVAVAAALAHAFALLRKRASPVTPVVFAAPIVIFAVWRAILAAHWGTAPLSPGAIELTKPFVEYARVLISSSSLRRIHRLHFTEAAYLGLGVILVLAALLKSSASTVTKLAWMAYLAMAATLPRAVWEEDVAFMRVLGDLHVTGAAVVIRHRAWLPATWLTASAVVWYYLASHLVKYS